MAIRVTTSVPGIFSPVRYQDKVMVDGGLLNNFPADLLHAEGMDVIIAVDVEREHEEEESRNIFEVIYHSFMIMMTEQHRANLKYADAVFRPEVGHILAFDKSRIRECIEAGERETEHKIDEIDLVVKYEAKWR